VSSTLRAEEAPNFQEMSMLIFTGGVVCMVCACLSQQHFKGRGGGVGKEMLYEDGVGKEKEGLSFQSLLNLGCCCYIFLFLQ
jgi:hypothetical protein